MHEKITPVRVPTPETGNLSELPARNARRHPDRVVMCRRDGDAWVDVTAAEWLAEIREVAKGFIAAGIEPGDRVALMSRTRYEWTLLDFALWTAGAVPVPVYETSSAHQVLWILEDSGARGIVVESAAHAATIDEIRGQAGELAHVWQIDGGGIEQLRAAGADIDDATLDARTAGGTRSDLATIIYTSGTTGRPKGCEITHGNFLGLSENILIELAELIGQPGTRLLLFLPIAHVFARLIEVVVVDAAVPCGHAPDVKNLLADLASFRPTFLLAVPRVFEKVYNAADQKATMEGKGRIFTLATRTAIAYSRAVDAGRVSPHVKALHGLFEVLVYRKLREAMGGVTWAVSGGAPLGERLGHYFRGIGVQILEGYGLTETTAPLTVNTPRLTRIGTVGAPLPGVGIRIDEDGEVLGKGLGIFTGYRGNEEATQGVFTDDGWFRTGDLGELDERGCLKITGRKKEIIVTAGGKNVAPAPLEDIVRAHPVVSQCLVVGEQRPFIGALLTIDAEMLPTWAKAHDRHGLTPETALDDSYVRRHIQMAIDRANATVSRAESIRDFRILPGDFTETNGYLTPSMKLKRNLILTDFADDVDALYAGTPAPSEGEKAATPQG